MHSLRNSNNQLTLGNPLDTNNTIGQTFLPADGLDQIKVYVEPEQPGFNELRLHLKSTPIQTTDLRVATIPSEQIVTPGFYGFTFSPLEESYNQNYYFYIEVIGSGILKIGSAPGSNYLNGALYLNDHPQDAQLTFSLGYDRGKAFIGLIGEGIYWIKLLFFACLLFILPGWAVLSWLLPAWDSLSWGEKTGLASGFSLAIYPILFLWTDLVGIHLDRFLRLAATLIGLLAIIWGWLRSRQRVGIDDRDNNQANPSIINYRWSSVFRNGTENQCCRRYFGARPYPYLFVRFWVIRILDAPMWGDSYQHTLIAQLFVDNGGLFTSWYPYAELQSFTYHFGFHTLVAVFHWISGLDLPQATLWVGQILNALAILALYPLAVRIGGNSWAGVIAILIAGLLTPMPMFYLNWGRYTQLAGQAILPAIVLLVWINLTTRDRTWRSLILIWIPLAGLALTHYRVMIFAAMFYLAVFLIQFKWKQVLTDLKLYLWHVIGFTVLILPWIIIFRKTPRFMASRM
jgi:hypothetical protein